MAGSTWLCMSSDIFLISLGHRHGETTHNFFAKYLNMGCYIIDVFNLHIKRFSRHTSHCFRLIFSWLPFTWAVYSSCGQIDCSIIIMFSDRRFSFKLGSKSCHSHSITAVATHHQDKNNDNNKKRTDTLRNYYRWVWALGMITLDLLELKWTPRKFRLEPT